MDEAREGFARYLLGQTDVPPPSPRAPVYRRLVWNSYRSVIEEAAPITRAILGPDAFEVMMAGFLAAGGPKTSLYRDIPAEFVAWAIATEQPYADLVHHEWMETVAAHHPADLDAWAASAEPGLAENIVRPNPTIQLGVYGRAVHRMSADEPMPEPLADPIAILTWRRPGTDETTIEVVGLLIARALALAATQPTSVDALVAQVAAEVPALDPAAIRAALDGVLAELAARDGVLR